MSANAAADPSERKAPSRRSRRSPSAAPSATSAGPAATRTITCGEVSWRSYQSGKASAGTVVSCGANTSPPWAAS